MFIAIPALGHIIPLLAQAAELRRRGWDVALASTAEVRAFVEADSRGVPFIALGTDPNGPGALANLQARAAARTDFLHGTVDIMRWVNTLWPTMFDGLLRQLRSSRADVLVVDLVSTAGMDAADMLGIPFVVNNADLLTAISVNVLPPAPGVPLLFSRKSLARVGPLDRVLNPPQRWLAAAYFDLTLGRQLNRLRRTRGLVPRRATRRVAGLLVMTDSAFGLEYSRPLPPLLQMVGPMLDDSDLAATLPGHLHDWLDDGPPVAFVNFGTFARPGGALTGRIAEAIRDGAFRALWVLRGDHPRLPSNVRIEPWVASQVAVLQHPNVHAFVSHCGINSAHESLFAGTPIVGIPLLADQYDMALRVRDAGVGILLDKQTFSAAELRLQIERVIHDERFRAPMPSIRAAFRLAGGVSRAADLIEHVARFGTARLRNV